MRVRVFESLFRYPGSEKDFETVAYESGEQCYLVKPVEIEDLMRLMHELTKNSGGCQ